MDLASSQKAWTLGSRQEKNRATQQQIANRRLTLPVPANVLLKLYLTNMGRFSTCDEEDKYKSQLGDKYGTIFSIFLMPDSLHKPPYTVDTYLATRSSVP
jgi:hypothetical protein